MVTCRNEYGLNHRLDKSDGERLISARMLVLAGG